MIACYKKEIPHDLSQALKIPMCATVEVTRENVTIIQTKGEKK